MFGEVLTLGGYWRSCFRDRQEKFSPPLLAQQGGSRKKKRLRWWKSCKRALVAQFLFMSNDELMESLGLCKDSGTALSVVRCRTYIEVSEVEYGAPRTTCTPLVSWGSPNMSVTPVESKKGDVSSKPTLKIPGQRFWQRYIEEARRLDWSTSHNRKMCRCFWRIGVSWELILTPYKRTSRRSMFEVTVHP